MELSRQLSGPYGYRSYKNHKCIVVEFDQTLIGNLIPLDTDVTSWYLHQFFTISDENLKIMNHYFMKWLKNGNAIVILSRLNSDSLLLLFRYLLSQHKIKFEVEKYMGNAGYIGKVSILATNVTGQEIRNNYLTNPNWLEYWKVEQVKKIRMTYDVETIYLDAYALPIDEVNKNNPDNIKTVHIKPGNYKQTFEEINTFLGYDVQERLDYLSGIPNLLGDFLYKQEGNALAATNPDMNRHIHSLQASGLFAHPDPGIDKPGDVTTWPEYHRHTTLLFNMLTKKHTYYLSNVPDLNLMNNDNYISLIVFVETHVSPSKNHWGPIDFTIRHIIHRRITVSNSHSYFEYQYVTKNLIPEPGYESWSRNITRLILDRYLDAKPLVVKYKGYTSSVSDRLDNLKNYIKSDEPGSISTWSNYKNVTRMEAEEILKNKLANVRLPEPVCFIYMFRKPSAHEVVLNEGDEVYALSLRLNYWENTTGQPSSQLYNTSFLFHHQLLLVNTIGFPKYKFIDTTVSFTKLGEYENKFGWANQWFPSVQSLLTARFTLYAIPAIFNQELMKQPKETMGKLTRSRTKRPSNTNSKGKKEKRTSRRKQQGKVRRSRNTKKTN